MKKMDGICITADSTARELEPIALAIYGMVGLPTTMRSKNNNGVRIENSKVVNHDYTGPYLEEALMTGRIVYGLASNGPYKGMPVIVSPIKNSEGETVAVLGTVNLSGYIDLKRF
ncbi:MAG: DUF2111 domain-containing protein [ANME-2 cluster archaeon]|nr:DUF2111 domain-containing protein [ANME-2 cluster archaeon]